MVTLWLGDDPLTPRRRANLDVMRDQIGLPVELVARGEPGASGSCRASAHPAYGACPWSTAPTLPACLMHHHGGAAGPQGA
ncbi:hypothetical protein QJS66_07300 [Kocuria rhizophila]|nr:hypothetical protein QJS66_07300 [Kocuria rhizophila]